MNQEDRERFAAVYDEHVWDVYGFIGYRVGGREATEDLTQQTFEKALRAWSRFDAERASPRTWLLAIARNTVIDHHRRDRSQRNVPIGPGDAELSEDSLTSPRPGEPDLGLPPELERALSALSDQAREVIALRFGADMTGPEIAQLTDQSLANVQQILSRSLRSLREALDPAS